MSKKEGRKNLQLAVKVEMLKVWMEKFLATEKQGYLERSPGMCCYLEGSECEIRLSEHLIKFCPNTDLKNILVHEMIHAYLYVTSNKKDHSYHGLSFTAMMNGINSSSETDPWRPSCVYNVTSSHDIRKEADGNRIQHWICTSCGDEFEGSKTSEPSANDCIEKMVHESYCGFTGIGDGWSDWQRRHFINVVAVVKGRLMILDPNIA